MHCIILRGGEVNRSYFGPDWGNWRGDPKEKNVIRTHQTLFLSEQLPRPWIAYELALVNLEILTPKIIFNSRTRPPN